MRFEYFSREFIQPININYQLFTKKNGYYLHLEDSQGNSGIGEISCLPGLHSDSSEQCKEQLSNFFNNHSLPLNLSTLKEQQLSSSALFALEGALIFQERQQNKMRESFSISVNSLCYPSQKNFPTNSCVKIKIGRIDPRDEIAFINQISKQTHSIRLDGNRHFTLSDYLQFATQIEDKSKIEYVEEPLINPQELPQAYRETQLPLALDESLPYFFSNNAFPPGIAAWILKPTVVGGILKTRELIKHAQSLGIKAIISSTFETEIGISQLALLAKDLPQYHHGLDTLCYFKSSSIKSTNGTMTFSC